MSKLLFPVGRMVGGSVHNAKVKTDKVTKQPKLDSSGQPITGFDFAVAYPKDGTTDWKTQTTWGQHMAGVANAAFGHLTATPTFAWKVTDGDSTIPNQNGKKPADLEGYPGHWVIWFSQGWAPKLCNHDGSVVLTEPDSIVPGYFVQVFADIKGNGAKQGETPGLYTNPDAVALAAYGERISGGGVDTASVGFGGAKLPAGASSVPVAAMSAQQAASHTAAPAPVAMPPAPPTVVTPQPAFLAPAPAAPPPAPTGPVMTAKAQGVTYEAYRAQNWTDAQLREHGLMV